MTATEAIAILSEFNRWRRDDNGDIDMPDPHDIGKSIDLVLSALQCFREISSMSPVARMLPDGSDERCINCLAMINHSRDALGFEPWPAAAYTELK